MNIAYGRLANTTIGILCMIFMVAPLVLVVLFSFGSSSLMTFPIRGFTFGWYGALMARDDFWSALANSATVTGAVGVAATVIGTAAAMVIVRLRPRQSAAAFFLFGLPMMMPPLVLALALLSLFSVLGVKLSLVTVVLAHLTFTMPFVILIVTARLRDFDYAVIDSARDLGASPRRIFIDIVFPIIRPTILGAALIVMALSLDDFIITFFTIGGENTLPTLLWGMMRKGVDPRMNACAFILVSLTLLLGGLALRLTRTRN